MPLRLRGAAVGGLHDAGAAAGADDEAPPLLLQPLRPVGQPARELAAVLVVARHRERLLGRGTSPPASRARSSAASASSRERMRAEPKKTMVSLILKASKRCSRFQVLGQDAQRPGVPAAHEAALR